MSLKKETFICLDCETTGLEPEKDRIIELAIVKFTFDKTLDQFETLIDPQESISKESIQIHNITDDMVQGKPKIAEVLPKALKLIDNHIIVGHAIQMDIQFIMEEAKRSKIPCKIHENPFLDTLRMARLYGQSPVNSLEKLRQHFNIAEEGAHRAMSDVIVNIEVFKYLSEGFKSSKEILDRLKKPISLKTMPLGKHKGRSFSEIPDQYLHWALKKNFDQDLTYSIRSELAKRKKTKSFRQASNPFSEL